MADVTISQIPTTITVQQVGIQGPAGSQGSGSFDTGSLMVTGSVTGNVLTFTKGDGSTFDLTVSSNSGGTPDIPLNSFQFNESGDFGGSAMYYDKNNERVGINITTPQADLHVRGGSNGTGSILLETDSVGVEEKAFAALYFRVADNDGANYKKFAVIAENTGTAYGAGRLHFAVNDQTGSTANAEIADSKLTLDYDGSVYMPDLHTGSQPHIIGYNSASGELTYYSTSSFIDSIETGSFMITGSVLNNVLTFTKGDGSTFSLTVATGSGGSSNTFPYTGSAGIQGPLSVRNADNSEFKVDADGSIFATGSWGTVGWSPKYTVNLNGPGVWSTLQTGEDNSNNSQSTVFDLIAGGPADIRLKTVTPSSDYAPGIILAKTSNDWESIPEDAAVAYIRVSEGGGSFQSALGDFKSAMRWRKRGNSVRFDLTTNASGEVDFSIISGSVIELNRVAKLASQHPLPTGEGGMLAVSSSASNEKLYFHDGSTWREVSLL